MNITVLQKAIYRKDKSNEAWANPAIIEVPGSGIRFVSGVPSSENDAKRINDVITESVPTVDLTAHRGGDPHEPK